MNNDPPASAMDADSVYQSTRERIAQLSPVGHAARVSRPLIKELTRMGLMAPFFAQTYGGSGDGQVSATLLCGICHNHGMEAMDDR